MQKFRLRADALEIDTFQVSTPSRWGGAVGLAERDGPRAAEYSGNDHCTGPSEVLPTCATCAEEHETCGETCADSCYPCWTGPKPICLDG
ncbi:MAG TPA: hypothetical protein VGB15_08275 [Longimicrobium sp.]|jgi:hypothetical protein